MKRLILIFFSVIICAVTFSAQNISIKANNESAETVFANIMRQSGKNFIYKPDLLKGLKINAEIKNLSLSETLKRIFDNTDVSYKIKGNNVILSRKMRKPVVPRSYRVSGFVKEAGTAEPIAGIIVTCGKLSTYTNAYGFYSLQVPEGEITLSVNGFNYLPASTSPFGLHKDKVVDFTVTPVKNLDELVVNGSKIRSAAMDAAGIGSLNLSSAQIRNTPAILGESDIIKTLQLEPGVNAGVEGFAGMYVHGGKADENLYMLDNIPLYQVNHLGGLFSAFNSEVMRNVDFYKSSFPARYDGRLSSYIDVHTKDGSTEKINGSFTLGLISGALDVNGPIGKNHKTTYSVGLRRSWLDLLTIPALAILNSTVNKEDKNKARYDFTDVNAKITHRFSDKSKAWLSVYYGEDYLMGGSKSDASWANYDSEYRTYYFDDITNKLYWGNLVASAGYNRVFSPKLFGDFTIAYTRYFSSIRCSEDYKQWNDIKVISEWNSYQKSVNNIDDWIARADFEWRPAYSHRVNFGANAILHSFLPQKFSKEAYSGSVSTSMSHDSGKLHALEFNGYISDDWKISDKCRMDVGVHLSSFHIDGKNHFGISPRFSFKYSPSKDWALKTSFSRTTQYVHQLNKSYISLPTDQWVPITGDFKPQTAEKVAVAAYWTPDAKTTISVETYYKWMHNLIDYADLFYLSDNSGLWNSKLCSGSGEAKGIDLKISREFGKLTGHVSYSLLWSDRLFAEKNGGRRFPSKFDNRHKINVALNWNINAKWDINAAWTGMSGNRFTLSDQVWIGPGLNDSLISGMGEYVVGYNQAYKETAPFIKNINNYQLPFYHRLDLSVVRHTKRGFWTISLFNAYCNLNTVAIVPAVDDNGKNIFRKLGIMPIIPSFSYTWKF